MERNPTRERLRYIARRHKPRGWRNVWHDPGADGKFSDEGRRVYGCADFEARIIHCVRIVDRYTLGVYLHECAHVHMRHMNGSNSDAQDEFEAEMYAIKAMRAHGIVVPARYIADSRAYIGAHVAAEPDIEHSEPLLKFVYGKKWREHA